MLSTSLQIKLGTEEIEKYHMQLKIFISKCIFSPSQSARGCQIVIGDWMDRNSFINMKLFFGLQTIKNTSDKIWGRKGGKQIKQPVLYILV